MKTSDNQRREVAQELRELRHTTYYREEVVENICDVISIADPVNTFREPEDVYKLLADLIDRPTCEMKGDPWAKYGRCSHCGAFVRRDAVTNCIGVIPVRCCPNCGARVVRGDE